MPGVAGPHATHATTRVVAFVVTLPQELGFSKRAVLVVRSTLVTS
jgi:hypothetical protein